MPKKHLFRFEFGDLTNSAVMLQCVIHAATRESAVNRLKRVLPAGVWVPLEQPQTDELEYIRVYFNRKEIYTRDIDEIT